MIVNGTPKNGKIKSTSLEELRVEINEIDNELLQLLSRRMKCAQGIGQYKKERNLPILQVTRWQEILNAAIQKGQQLDLSDTFITQFLTAIHDESIRHQTEVFNGEVENLTPQ